MGDMTGLGRRISHDPRDRNFLLAPRPEAIGIDYRYWTAHGIALDQGGTSQCVGYSGHQWLTSFPVSNRPPFTPADLYKEAQRNDEWEGEDYEGSSVRGLFKVLKAKGYVGEYRWSYDVGTVVDHLLVKGPVVVGTIWTHGMFAAREDGYIDDIGGEIIGGHAYLLIGASRIRVSDTGEKGAVRVLNSWGPNWEDRGRAWLSFKALDWLLRLDGEACTADEVKL